MLYYVYRRSYIYIYKILDNIFYLCYNYVNTSHIDVRVTSYIGGTGVHYYKVDRLLFTESIRLPGF